MRPPPLVTDWHVPRLRPDFVWVEWEVLSLFCPVSSVFLSFVPCLFWEKLTFAKTTYKPTEMKNLLLALSAAAILTSCGGRDAATMPIDLPADSIAHLDTLMAMASGAPVDPWSQRDLYGTSLLAAMQRAREGLSPYWTEGVDPAPRVPVMGNFDIWY